MKSLSHVQLFATPWTIDPQAPPSMGFSRQEYWSGLPSPLGEYKNIDVRMYLNLNYYQSKASRHSYRSTYINSMLTTDQRTDVKVVVLWASLVAQSLKHLPAMWETWIRSLGHEDPLEKEMATHSSILAWRIPWTEEPSWLQSMGLLRVAHD